MLIPEFTGEFVRVFEPPEVRRAARLQRENVQRGAEARARLTEVEHKIAGIVASIGNGTWNRRR